VSCTSRPLPLPRCQWEREGHRALWQCAVYRYCRLAAAGCVILSTEQHADPVLPCVRDNLEPALLWVQSELKEWINAPPEGCCLESCDPVLQWVILMQGPEACGGRSLYDGEVFRWRPGIHLSQHVTSCMLGCGSA